MNFIPVKAFVNKKVLYVFLVFLSALLTHFVFISNNMVLKLGSATIPYINQLSTLDWMSDVLFILNESLSYDECKICTKISALKRPSNIYDSSDKDLVITFAIKNIDNLFTFVSTLRSTGCKANVIVFHDDLALKQSQETLNEVRKCGVYFINLGLINNQYLGHIFEIRHPIIHRLLEMIKDDYNRVLIVDSSDTFFQYDPFTINFSQESLVFTTENSTFGNDENNDKWIKGVNTNNFGTFIGKIPLCFGLYYGGIKQIINFYDLFLQIEDFRSFSVRTIDQGYLNYYYYTGYFRDNNISIDLSPPGSHISTNRRCHYDTKDNFPYKLLGSDKPFGVCHNYNRMCPLLEDLKVRCPSELKHAFAKGKEISQSC